MGPMTEDIWSSAERISISALESPLPWITSLMIDNVLDKCPCLDNVLDPALLKLDPLIVGREHKLSLARDGEVSLLIEETL